MVKPGARLSAVLALALLASSFHAQEGGGQTSERTTFVMKEGFVYKSPAR
ncbi:MAG: hypothetical protein LC795_05115 [Acidobacteria bacterium]|nr:hypothetical protein [Acidobacteriota bacterium]